LSCLAAGLRAIGIDDAVAVPFLAPLLGVLPGEYSATADLSPARRRIRSIEVLTEVLAALCAEAPTLLIVEDLHWADESTVELLERVVGTFPALGLLGIFTSRPEFDGTWGRDSPLRTIHSTGSATPSRPRSPGRWRVARRCPASPSGRFWPAPKECRCSWRAHPVHVRVRDAAGVVGIPGRSWPAGGRTSSRWPSTRRSRRASTGSVRPRSTAQIAATIGREFSVELLREVSGATT
jgi:hypothetical protein